MFLYHTIPKDFSGQDIYPLNQLKTIRPDLYSSAAAKYSGREATMEQVIPFLGCLWNDVVFLSPVAPNLIVEARREFGLVSGSGKAFVIKSDDLDQNQLVLYRHRPQWLIDRELNKPEYVRFSELADEDKEQLALVPNCAKWSMNKVGAKSLFYGYTPHLLYRGVVNVSGATILEF